MRTSLYQFLCLVFFFPSFQPNLASSSSSVTHLCFHHEAAALIQFKNSFSIDEYASLGCIESNPKTNAWEESTDCCQWDGVTCDNEKGQVIGLDLSCSWLSGSIHSNCSLFQLPHLRRLNLAFNSFDSSNMSSEFGKFESLEYLNLSGSSFSGQVPSQLSHLSKLVSLDLSRNDDQTLDKHTLKGLVENLTKVRELSFNEINMSSINLNVLMNLSSSIWSLSLYTCGLSGKFPENIFHLPNLKFLNLGDNQDLSLSLPKFNRSSHLEYLDGSYANFNGELPDSIGNLVSLTYLDVSHTNLSGGLPNSIGNLVSLGNLDFSYTNLSGRLPSSIGNLVSLKYLDLRGAKLSGTIPRSLGNLSQLGYLDLSENFFSGQLPYSLTNLSQLEDLKISLNSIEGSIPEEVIAFPNLFTLDLSSNLLNGTLPAWLYVVSSLRAIYLHRNQLSGLIKEFQCTLLEEIRLDDNRLEGLVASSVSQLVNLADLDLSSNNLSGNLELGMFSKLENLRILDISRNSPTINCNGTSATYELPNLDALHLPSCSINEFPQFLKGSKNLLELDLSNNKISKIPKWMWDVGKVTLSYLNLSHNSLTDLEQLPWQEIKYLDLSSNLIHGDLPITPSTTQIFLISNNSLSGEISSLICSMSDLDILDLSHNNLSGIIPQCFGDLSQSASTLNLQKNRLSGIIPSIFAKGCQLSNLNLNGNQLKGPLTRSISNCTRLEVLDLGNNKIKDTFPHWLGSLPELQVLVLKSNHFHGPIYDTRSAASFSKIQIFDLSNNHFIGPLPVRYVKNFRAMINLTKNGAEQEYMGANFPNSALVSGTTNMGHSTGNFYSYSTGISIKGHEIDMVKIFSLLACIDLSNNKFEGEIPKVIGQLNSLKGLNISHNNLSGCIPTSMGSLTSLEWLDLSSNKLVGMIPQRFVELTSLSFFNVSENQLDGQIPQGKQFNTFGNDSYEGNKGLCGFPVSKSCSSSEAPHAHLVEEDDSKPTFGWKEVLTGYVCGAIFGLAMGYVVFRTGKPKWFLALFEDRQHKRQKRTKIGNRSGGGRRI